MGSIIQNCRIADPSVVFGIDLRVYVHFTCEFAFRISRLRAFLPEIWFGKQWCLTTKFYLCNSSWLMCYSQVHGFVWSIHVFTCLYLLYRIFIIDPSFVNYINKSLWGMRNFIPYSMICFINGNLALKHWFLQNLIHARLPINNKIKKKRFALVN